MIITGNNLDLFYRNKKRGYFDKYKDIINGKIGYELEIGQDIYSITYLGMSSNKLLKYFCKIIDIDDKGILFADWHGTEIFYQWELNYKNYLGKIDKMKLIIRPCDNLFEKYPIKKLIKHDELNNKIWYKHGGYRIVSSYEKNLANFKILGQQELIV